MWGRNKKTSIYYEPCQKNDIPLVLNILYSVEEYIWTLIDAVMSSQLNIGKLRLFEHYLRKYTVLPPVLGTHNVNSFSSWGGGEGRKRKDVNRRKRGWRERSTQSEDKQYQGRGKDGQKITVLSDGEGRSRRRRRNWRSKGNMKWDEDGITDGMKRDAVCVQNSRGECARVCACVYAWAFLRNEWISVCTKWVDEKKNWREV